MLRKYSLLQILIPIPLLTAMVSIFHVPIQWFLFRDTYMGRIDKTEDRVSKLFREYQDNWNKYAEGMEKGPDNVKVTSCQSNSNTTTRPTKYMYMYMYSARPYIQ